MKVKELKKNKELCGIKVKIPKKYEDSYMGIKGEMYIYSWWSAGVWFKKSMKDNRIFPLNMDPKKVLDFVIVK